MFAGERVEEAGQCLGKILACRQDICVAVVLNNDVEIQIGVLIESSVNVRAADQKSAEANIGSDRIADAVQESCMSLWKCAEHK
ncbi:hypothetical protein CK231_31495 [Mesorhizobium loti]|uniref:Uncharacterized protein n=1 Tax=Rhizobium loti TaxID=381 RepID=A0A1A5JMF2_RHILI|nr:hypothetical protein [Mesorhizobium sp. BR115XR7A]OBP74964.1 hypothetical protein BAE42_31130 [Mesorhizobium loti]MBZ9910471.1 hypothetical protein [Mesorhizobium sp. BR115XR7A]OBP75037.1 hypothetical protein BAE39_31190 [Mesorhizobium loti]OBP75071.1 hypothetical protein BAE41_31355 [Mesorhizobium loti]OBP92673.1 hypothetical protein BAE38_31355 [Mesorhizobium loti]